MNCVLQTKNLTKNYRRKKALNNISLNLNEGEIVGLIGPNGAGKTTLLKALLGLISVEGEIRVLDKNPKKSRVELLKDVCFIADTAILPRWLRVDQALAYMANVHPRFDRKKAEAMLEKTDIPKKEKVSNLSKGMVTQLHLSLILAIDSKLLILDEPTLGLDILNRKSFYTTLLNDYHDESKTIVITTHQVEEIENILTRAIFIRHGELALDSSIDEITSKYREVLIPKDRGELLSDEGCLYTEKGFEGDRAIFNLSRTQSDLDGLNSRVPNLADLFVALMTDTKGAENEI